MKFGEPTVARTESSECHQEVCHHLRDHHVQFAQILLLVTLFLLEQSTNLRNLPQYADNLHIPCLSHERPLDSHADDQLTQKIRVPIIQNRI